MDGLCRPVGAGCPCPVGGRTYFLEPLTLARLGACEQWVLALRESPLDRVAPLVAGLASDPDLATSLWMRAFEEFDERRELRLVEYADLLAWLDTPPGLALTAFLCFQRNPRPPFPWLERAEAHYRAAPAAEVAFFKRVRDQVSGLDLMASLDWPPAEGGVTSKHLPWRKIFNGYGVNWQWDHEVVGRMTLYHLKLFVAGELELGGKVDLPPGQAQLVKQQRQEARAERRGRLREHVRAALGRGNPDRQ